MPLDAARGLAIALMTVDHALLAFGAPAWTRLGPTRLALPVFMLVFGMLWRDGWRRRHVDVALAALVSIPLMGVLGGPAVPVLVVIVVVLVVMNLTCRLPIQYVLVAAVMQATTWPLGWDGYEPGLLLAFALMGRLAGFSTGFGIGALDVDGPLRRSRWLAFIGRYPLAFYLGHLSLLAGWVAVMGLGGET